MPKAKKMVEWCLSKAKKEIAEGKKHRGLVKVQPDSSLAKAFLEKAEHNLEVFQHNQKKGYYDWCINMGFYCMYHCCLAIITKFGYESRNQECTLALVESLIADKKLEEDFRAYIEAIKSSNNEGEEKILNMREKYQYTPIIKIDEQKVQELLKLCQDMIKDTKGVVNHT